MIQIAICDDEQNSRIYLKKLIQHQHTECEINEYTSGEMLLHAQKEHDILFLDIELKEELSGMTLAKEIRNRQSKKQPIIIFVTGYKEYVFDAFDVDAFHYLVKPVVNEKFTAVFEKALRKINAEQETAEQRKTEQGKTEQGETIKNLHIQTAAMNKVISINDIFYAESQNHKILLHTKNGVFEYYAKISDLEHELKEQFFRIHKGYLLNMGYIEHYTKNEVILTNGENLPISKYKYMEFVKTYLRFMELKFTNLHEE